MIGAILGLVASLITFRGLWAAAGTVPPPPPTAAASDEEGDGGEEKVAGEVVKEAEPYVVESDKGVSDSASSYVDVKAAQA